MSRVRKRIKVNGSLDSFDVVNCTVSTLSPLQRTSVSTLDDKGRVIQSAVPQIAPVNYQYDNHGRLQTVSQSADGQTRTVSYDYDQTQNGGASSGRLTAITDALNRTNTFTYDPNLSGRVVRQTFPNGRFIEFQYDANGNLTGVTPPQKPVHVLDFNGVDLLTQYTPPLAPDTGNNFTTYAYNLNRQLTNVTRPDGLHLNFVYEPLTGRLDHIDLPFNERISYQYVQAGCGCSGAGRPENVTFQAVDYTTAIHYSYDASLVTGVTWSGPVAGSVNATYDDFFRVNSLSVNGANQVTLGYDDDGLLVQAGALTLSRDPQNGRLTGTTLGSVNDGWTYTGLGEPESYTAYAGNTLAYFTYFLRDNAGRITNKVEIIDGATNVYEYAYDPARGWLTHVSSNSIPTAHYEYDDNGNRTLALTLYRVVSYAAADDQDRILSATETFAGQAPQSLSWIYSANGELQTKTVGTGSTPSVTSCNYDVRGALRSVTLPNATQIAYVIDATGRRIGKKVNGVLAQGWLYQDSLKPIAELDGAGNVVSRFVYAGKANVPEYLVRGGTTYRLITDHLGSVRLVVNASSGAIAQRLDYDEFGRVLADTNPGFQPFGFVGGLYDPATGLVRFGARDYDTETGRWTSKDPIGFAGANNWYAYVGNNPISLIDPYGLWSFYRWLYTGDGNASDEVYDAATEAAGDYIHCNSPLRGAYGFAGVQTPKGKSLVPGSHVHGEVLGLAGWDVGEGGWGGAIAAGGVGPLSGGVEYIHGHPGIAPIVLADSKRLPIGGYITQGPNGAELGIYLHKDLGKFGTVGGGFYWDVNKLGNYVKPDYWKGRMSCECP